MYTRLIDVKRKTVNFSDQIEFNTDISEFPDDVTYYIEEKDDWWVEREPFKGREKDEEVRLIALNIFKEFEDNEIVKTAERDVKVYYTDYDKFYLRRKIDLLLEQAKDELEKLKEMESEDE